MARSKKWKQSVVGRIIKEKNRIIKENDIKRKIGGYSKKGRYINNVIYRELKGRTICDRCKRRFLKGRKPEIHHIIPVRNGGSNERENLLALCIECHAILDGRASDINRVPIRVPKK